MTFGDPPNAYFAPTARDLAAFEAGKAEAAALIASQAARIRELEEGVRPLSLAASLMSGDPDDRVVSVGRWYDYDDGNPPRFGADVQLTVGHFRRARSLLSRKGGE